MGVRCNPCDGSGFVNLHQVPDSVLSEFRLGNDAEVILSWMQEQTEAHDVKVCDCCGNGDDSWHGDPGEHDPSDYNRKSGPYEYNGGVPECY